MGAAALGAGLGGHILGKKHQEILDNRKEAQVIVRLMTINHYILLDILEIKEAQLSLILQLIYLQATSA